MSEALDFERAFKRDGHLLCPLLLRAERGCADDVVVDINPASMRVMPGVGAAVRQKGNIVFFTAVVLISFVFFSGQALFFRGIAFILLCLFIFSHSFYYHFR